MTSPCNKCSNAGCGSYHDICPEYQEFVNQKKMERKDINDRKNFARSKMKTTKGHWTWGRYKNLGY